MKPRRVQLSRTKGWRMPANTVKVDRSTKWGNPFRIGETYPHPAKRARVLIASRDQSVVVYKAFIESPAGRKIVERARIELKGKNLGCWCKLGGPCHADFLLLAANGGKV